MLPFTIQLLHTFLSAIFGFNNPEVNTNLGKVIGKKVFYEDTPIYTFQSIPYAKPPTGEYRFKKPIPVESWDSPLLATQLPPGCMSHLYIPLLQSKSEDCLYLNIWTPSISETSEKKAVIFFIHGGYFTIGSSRFFIYDGTTIAALGDVVVVTINYRLGPLGFLYAGTENAPGNMALYDMLEALKWVNSNIRYFGGDESRLTIFGQSAGAIAINMFMTSPLAQGYFHRAILESGTGVSLNGENNDKDYINSQKIAAAVGCSNDSVTLANAPDKVVQCLRGVDAHKLCKTLEEVSDDPLRSIYPRYGDEILPNNTRLSIIAGNFANISILIGANNNEGSMILTKVRPDVFGYLGYKNHRINKTFGESLIREHFQKFPDPKAVVEHYLGDVNEHDYDTVLQRVQAAFGESERTCPSVYLSESVAEKGSDVYFYFFQHRPSVTPWAHWMGVVHFDEVPFVFGIPLRIPIIYKTTESELSENMIKMWTSFAKTGHPGQKEWPLYSKQHHYYWSLKTNRKHVGSGPHLENCNFLRKYYGF